MSCSQNFPTSVAFRNSVCSVLDWPVCGKCSRATKPDGAPLYFIGSQGSSHLLEEDDAPEVNRQLRPSPSGSSSPTCSAFSSQQRHCHWRYRRLRSPKHVHTASTRWHAAILIAALSSALNWRNLLIGSKPLIIQIQRYRRPAIWDTSSERKTKVCRSPARAS